MSEQVPEEKVPDLRGILLNRDRDKAGKQVLDEFITSNDNNPTKSRIPTIYGMTIDELLNIFWASTAKVIKIEVQGKSREIPRTVSGAGQLFKMWYDENAISAGGASRDELKVASLGFFLSSIEDVERAQSQKRAEEGQKKK